MPRPPFVLLDDARSGAARLYEAPVETVAAHGPDEVRPALAALRAARARGLHAAGWLGYEAGAALVARAPVLPVPGGAPLLWFGLFAGWTALDAAGLAALLGDPDGAVAGSARPLVARAEYDRRLARVLDLIRAGDLYQANLTFPAEVPVLGPLPALYARLRRASAAAHGALVDTGEHQLLSLSPELFFDLADGALTCRPMKGTATRGATPAADRAAAAALAADPKQRAENLMIVDLMRNDLAQVAAPGSVAVPALWTTESYPTLHQLTSTVTARLAPGLDAVDVVANLFPCGSVTGAPKTRAMQVIAAVEEAGRGVYCGAVGRLDAADDRGGGDASFNVAIRTLTIAGGRATLGLGSAVTADSMAGAEWAECLAKAGFLAGGRRSPDLVETMRFDPEAGIALLERHLARLTASAAALGMAFDRHGARNDLQAATFRLRSAARVRLLLAAGGAVAVEVAPPPAPVASLTAAVAPLPVDPADWRLAHKTAERGWRAAALAAAGTAEVVFERPDGLLTEGSWCSLFVARDGVLLTPPLGLGLLPGVLRAELLAQGRAREAMLRRGDLAGGFLLGNALRGLIPARLADGAGAA